MSSRHSIGSRSAAMKMWTESLFHGLGHLTKPTIVPSEVQPHGHSFVSGKFQLLIISAKGIIDKEIGHISP